MLSFENVTYGYNKNRPVVKDLSFSIGSGSICGLLGRNGAGKTTILYLICGLLRPHAGKIICDGFNPVLRQASFLRDVFLVPEEFRTPDVSLGEYIAVNAPFYPKFSMEDMLEYLRIFDLDANLHLAKVSMGQKKKAMLSFALACNTKLLILDEPTNGLDISSKRSFRQAVTRGMTDERTIIISTHQVYDVDKILDHVIITDNDGILLDSPLFDISNRLRFTYTNDPVRSNSALLSLQVPGGWNIIELTAGNESDETEVNLESLFELVTGHRDVSNRIFSKA